MWIRILSLAFVVGLAATDTRQLDAQQAPPPKPLRVLFVGNSYTFFNHLPQQIQMLVLSSNQTRMLETHQVTRPGADLRSHWLDSTSMKAIRRTGWDYVVLQEQSNAPISRPDSMLKYVRFLAEEIRRTGAKPLLFLTWARKDRPSDQATLTAAYERAAREIGAALIPVGPAVASMAQRTPTIEFFHDDASHPQPAGSYLAACVFYGFLYDRSPVGLPGHMYRTTYQTFNLLDVDVGVERLTVAEAESLQKLAWEVVQAHRDRR